MKAYQWLPVTLNFTVTDFVNVDVTPDISTLSTSSTGPNLSHANWHGYFWGPPDWSGAACCTQGGALRPTGRVCMLTNRGRRGEQVRKMGPMIRGWGWVTDEEAGVCRYTACLL